MDTGADTSHTEAADAGVAGSGPDTQADGAWARVLAAWDDEAAHRAYVGGLADLDRLAAAGRRYRAVLAERPGDAPALRALGHIVERATVQGLASLPRTPPPHQRFSPSARRALIALVAALALAAGVALMGHLGARS
jgi:hypothetical protein